NRHDGEELLDRPAVGHRLEDRKIAEVRIRHERFQTVQLFRNIIELANDLEKFAADRPEELFRQSAQFDSQVAKIKEVHRIVDGLHGMVVTLQEILFGKVTVDSEEIGNRLRGVRGDLGRRLVAVKVRHAQHVEDEQAMVGDYRPARFGDDGRVRYARLLTD